MASIPLSEARSYANLAAGNSYWGIIPPSPPHLVSPSSTRPSTHPSTDSSSSSSSTIPIHPRIHVEERALDSYQNILFSIIHFWRSCSPAHTHWPGRLTVVSHVFKRRRLVEAHCAAIGFPLDRVRFLGTNPPGVPEVLGAEERAVEEWMADPQGQSDGLRGKRWKRNPWAVTQTLFLGEAEREKSEVETRLIDAGNGEEETLVDGGLRPWGKAEGASLS